MSKKVRGILRRDLELADRVVDEHHLLVGDAQVVVRVGVVDADLLRDALLELREDLLDVDLLVGGGVALGGLEPVVVEALERIEGGREVVRAIGLLRTLARAAAGPP